MARYLILGGGKFGRLALRRLPEQDEQARFLVIERRAETLAEVRRMGVERAEMLEGDAIAYLAAHLTPGFPWDWLIPMAPVHVAYAWLLAGPLSGKGWEQAEVPASLESLAALAIRGREGELYLSRARHRCPDDCAEPPICPVTGEERGQPLFEKLMATSRPELPILVVASRQLAPGIGGYSPQQLLDLAERVADMSGPVLVATACRCHGVVHGLQPTGEKRA
ncbi:MAG: hypothetical protein ACUVXF_03780 [Desulfobaccales bacterium]